MPLLHLGSLPRKVSKSEILAFINNVGGLDHRRIGKLSLQGDAASVEVPAESLARLCKALDGQKLGERRVRVWTELDQTTAQGGSVVADHFARLTRLLELESDAEAQQAAQRAQRLSPTEAERSGTSLLDLVVRDEAAGLGGRYLIRLGRRRTTALPWTRLSVGSPVVLSIETAQAPHRGEQPSGYRGVVSARDGDSIEVAVTAMPDELNQRTTWRIDLCYDEIAVERQRRALSQTALASGDRLAQLRDIALGERPLGEPRPNSRQSPPQATPTAQLNAVQLEAIDFALARPDFALIHGPPGTGKTTTLVELICRAVAAGQRVLACAPSNTAVDNLAERLITRGQGALRLGHPARVSEPLRQHTLDLLVEHHPDLKLARRLTKEALAILRQANRYTRAKPQRGARQDARQEARQMMADARALESRAAEHLLDTTAIHCVTTTGIDATLLGTRHYDLVVLDEACQSTEPGCWIPLLRADRVVLAGDHCQLPPTVVSREALEQGFGVSLFERLMQQMGPSIARRLTVQYRMHRAIMEFPSREFYDDSLVADPSVAEHLLADLPGVVERTVQTGTALAASPLANTPLEFIDTAGASYDEELEPDGQSRRNPQEARLALLKVRQLLELGVAASQIAIITPYAAQARLLREQLDLPELEIDSVDGFQGREKEAVVISLVRSNSTGEIGFLSDVRRMNVAMTRARRKLILIGDSATLAHDAFYDRLIESLQLSGAYHTVWEEAGIWDDPQA